MKLLLEKGAELESKDDEYGQTPLSRAAGEGHEAVVKLLLEKGAELESKDDTNGRTPLSWCQLLRERSIESDLLHCSNYYVHNYLCTNETAIRKTLDRL